MPLLVSRLLTKIDIYLLVIVAEADKAHAIRRKLSFRG